jgi:Zn-dependent protease with chaperone function
MNTTGWPAATLLTGLLVLVPAGAAHAQFLELLKKLPPPSAGIPLAPGLAKDGTTAAVMANAPPVAARQGIEIELQPDANCSRAREKFDVMEKVLEFGGTAASLRLSRLIETDFAYSDLTPQDQQMLRYVAQTTVWLPAEAEGRLGGLGDTFFSLLGRSAKLTELDEEALKQLSERLALLKAQTNDFPGEIRLKVDDGIPTGAFAQFGNVIVVSRSFLNGLTQSTAGADFVLAHELSHIYKRHAIKDIQFKLISTKEGWELARKVLRRASRGLSIDPISDGIFTATVIPELVNYVRGQQLSYGREQELESDACSVAWLQGMGTNPIEAWVAYRTTLAATDMAPTSYASTHPSTPEREMRFTSKVEGKGAPTAAARNKGPAARERPSKP